MHKMAFRSSAIALSLLFGHPMMHAQCTNSWVHPCGGPLNLDRAIAVAADSLGNTYVAGQFMGSATFGDTVLVSVGSEDIFLAKYALDGDLLWIRAAGSQGTDVASDLLVVNNDLVVLCGNANSTVTFGAFTHANTSGLPDAFLVAYTSAGDVSWLSPIAGSGWDLCDGLAHYGSSGTFFATGSFEGALSLGTDNMTSTGVRNNFVCAVGTNGAVQWARSIPCSILGSGGAVAQPDAASVIVCGGFSGALTFNGNSYPSAGSSDGFLAKYSTDGDAMDLLTFGGTLEDYFTDVAAGANGELFASFIFSGSVQVGGIPLTSSGDKDGGIVRVQVNDLGCTHIARIGGIDRDQVNAIACASTGVVMATGSVFGSASFGNIDVVSASDDENIYYALFDGNDLAATNAATTGGPLDYDIGVGITVDRFNDITLVGQFRGNTIFDGTPAAADVNSGDAFVWRLCTSAAGMQNLVSPALDLHVRPVPNDGIFQMEIPAAIGTPAQLRVFDMTGRTVYQQRLTGGLIQEVGTDLPAGTYTVDVMNANSHARQQFVVAH